MKLLIVPLLFCLVGCVPFPVYKTLQPAARMVVTDADGRPLSTAEVSLIANAYPYGFERGRDTRQTDQNGVAKFPSRKEWRTEAPLMMHGSEVFFWNWCVRKEGYSTYVTANHNRRSFASTATVVLTRGESQMCPKAFR
jgi:hypothetical protein